LKKRFASRGTGRAKQEIGKTHGRGRERTRRRPGHDYWGKRKDSRNSNGFTVEVEMLDYAVKTSQEKAIGEDTEKKWR